MGEGAKKTDRRMTQQQQKERQNKKKISKTLWAHKCVLSLLFVEIHEYIPQQTNKQKRKVSVKPESSFNVAKRTAERRTGNTRRPVINVCKEREGFLKLENNKRKTDIVVERRRQEEQSNVKGLY